MNTATSLPNSDQPRESPKWYEWPLFIAGVRSRATSLRPVSNAGASAPGRPAPPEERELVLLWATACRLGD
jgi:hypothetical protein